MGDNIGTALGNVGGEMRTVLLVGIFSKQAPV